MNKDWDFNAAAEEILAPLKQVREGEWGDVDDEQVLEEYFNQFRTAIEKWQEDFNDELNELARVTNSATIADFNWLEYADNSYDEWVEAFSHVGNDE